MAWRLLWGRTLCAISTGTAQAEAVVRLVLVLEGEFGVDKPGELGITEGLVPGANGRGAGGDIEFLDMIDKVDERGSVVPVSKVGVVFNVADGDVGVLVRDREGTLEAVVAAPGMSLRRGVGLGDRWVVRCKTRPTKQLTECRRRRRRRQWHLSHSYDDSWKKSVQRCRESCDCTCCPVHKPCHFFFSFFFKPNGVEIAAPEAPWRQGRSRQTLKRENEREVSKTVFADGFSHWLRGEDAGSPGAFLHCTLDIES